MTALCGLFLWVNKKMAMKQIQTKLFDFSDVGLDFSAGSKNLFPDRFKKMLSLGYNVQTVTSVALAGNQVTFTYGGAHGYAANRVLKVDSGTLASINGGEFWIDFVTTNTVTFTLDAAPAVVVSGFTTRIASLGWSLEYEVDNIHVYKFKALDESDLYIRLCFQNVVTNRNTVSPCVGVSFDPTTGYISDANAITANKSTMQSLSGFRWDFCVYASSTHNNYSYLQGINLGLAKVVGSEYGFLCGNHSENSSDYSMRINGVWPCAVHDYSVLQKVLLIGSDAAASTASAETVNATHFKMYCGNYDVINQVTTSSAPEFVDRTQAALAYLPESIEAFNTTTAEPIPLYLKVNGQHLGFLVGMYRCKYSPSYVKTSVRTTMPELTRDEKNVNVFVHLTAMNTTSSSSRTGENSIFYAIPIEEIKVA